MPTNPTASKVLYNPMPPVTPMPKIDMLSAERLAYNIKLNMMTSSTGVPMVAPDGDTPMSNLIDIICACLIKEILNHGFGETLVSAPGTPMGPTASGSPIPVVDTILIPADGPGHTHANAHKHEWPISAIKFR